MAMFDWNDEELTDIIWGGAGESDDHIVPYPIQNEGNHPSLFRDTRKRKTDQEISYVSHADQKEPHIGAEHGVKLVSSSKHAICKPVTGFSLNPWPDRTDKSIINGAKADQDSTGNGGSKKGLKGDFSRDETVRPDTGSEFLQNPPDDEGQDDYVDYEWANIRSFDDLDRIFSNDDPIFGNASGNADDPFLSSSDSSSGPKRLTPTSGDSSDILLAAVKMPSAESDIKAQSTLESSQSFISYENLNEIKSLPQNVQMIERRKACSSQLNDATAARLLEFHDKDDKRKILHMGQKLEEKAEVKQMHDYGATWIPSPHPFQQVQYTQSVVHPCSPLVLSQKRQFQRAENNISGSVLESPLYGSMVYHYPAASVLSPFHHVEGNQNIGNVNLLKNSLDATTRKPPEMTPKEKIEKLRRRQQLRAILAIQKQQQQFGDQVSVTENSTLERRNANANENMSSFSFLDHSSSIEGGDNKKDSIFPKNCSVEESVLHQLQDTVSKLDARIRFCIRDSLFRLAESALQRQCLNETNNVTTGSRDDTGNTDIDNHERFNRMADVEKETNPIDRVVAHFLFHTPLELSGKLSDNLDSPVSSNLPYERNANALKSLAKGYILEAYENAEMTFPQGLVSPCIYLGKNQSNNSSCLDAPDNASNHEATNGLQNVEASKS